MRQPTRQLAVLDAPSNLGLRPPKEGQQPGCRRMAAALRACDIVQRLAAHDAGMVAAPPYDPAWSPGAGPPRNEAAIAGYTPRLAERIEGLFDERLPVVLGGDCSILLGSMLALRRRGRYGLLFVDGHLDFRHPGNAEYVGAVAGEDLAVVTGRGSDALADIDHLRPYVEDADVVAFGFREGPEAGEALDIVETEIVLADLATAREQGIGAAIASAIDYLSKRGLDGFWTHVDVDVLDSDLMPAVDSPQPDGLSWEEFVAVLQAVRAAPSAVGCQFTIFDPNLDADGALARRLTDAIVEGLSEPAGRGNPR